VVARPKISQAKNLMRRTVEEIVDPGPRDIDPLWDHFEAQCAYCGKRLSRDKREGHVDHAVSGGGNHLGNLVLACGGCNGDEKRESSWREFLQYKTPDPALLSIRQARIETWFERHPGKVAATSPQIEQLRAELEQVIDQFAVKCAELRNAVTNRDEPLA